MLGLLIDQGALKLDRSDEIVSAMLIDPGGANGTGMPGRAAVTGEAA